MSKIYDLFKRVIARIQLATSKHRYGLDEFLACVRNNKIREVELFLQAGIDVNASGDDGYTALVSAADKGHTGIVSLLLREKDIQINAQTKAGYTALISASEKGHVEIVSLLLEKKDINVNAQTKAGDTALTITSRIGNSDIVRLLARKLLSDQGIGFSEDEFLACVRADKIEQVELFLRGGVNVNASGDNGYTALIIAAEKGHTGIVSLLLREQGIQINAQTKVGDTALISAADKGHVEIVSLLLREKDVLINAQTKYGYTALISAAEKGHVEIVSLLLREKDIDVNAQTEAGYTALISACEKGHTEIVSLLLREKDIDVNAQTKYGCTALISACEKGHTEIVALLLREKDIHIDAQTKVGDTALICASRIPNVDIVRLLNRKLLLQAGIEFSVDGFLTCVRANQTREVKRFLGAGIDVNAIGDGGYTALISAAEEGHIEIVSLLLREQGIQVNAQTKVGDTALIGASKKGDTEIASLLLGEKGIDVDVQTKAGDTALIGASRTGKLDLVRLLLEQRDAQVNLCNKQGISALYEAIVRGHTEIEKLLDVHRVDRAPVARKLLSEAGIQFSVDRFLACVRADQTREVKWFLEVGIDVNASGDDGYTALISASKKGYTEIASLLLGEEGIDVNAQTTAGDTALIVASRTGNLDLVRLLLEHGNVKLDECNSHGVSALYEAIVRGHTEIEKLLDDRGVNRTRVAQKLLAEIGIEFSVDGFLACVRANQTRGVKRFLEAGIDVNARGDDGYTALISAAEKGHTGIVSLLLREHGIQINAQTKAGDTALISASKKGYTEIVSLLLGEEGIDVNAQIQAGDTALIIASRTGNLDLVRLLLEHGNVELDARNNHDINALYEAIVRGHAEIEKLLDDHGVDRAPAARKLLYEKGIEFSPDAFLAAVRDWNEQVVVLFLDAGMDPDARDPDRNTPLILAAEMGWFSLVQILLKRRADVNARNKYDASAIVVAANSGQQQIVDCLKDVRADERGLCEIELVRAIEQGNLGIVKAKLAQNPPLNFQTPRGESPLSLAIRANAPDIARALLDKGAPVDAKGGDGKTALMQAAELNLSEMIELLVGFRANVNETSNEGKTALILAAERGHASAVDCLLKKGADANIQDHSKWTALTTAILREHAAVADILRPFTREDIRVTLYKSAEEGRAESLNDALERAAIPNVTDDRGNTLLMIASGRGQLEAVKKLLDYHAEVNVRNKTGDTALVLAARSGHVEVVQELLHKGARQDAINNRKNTALVEAASQGRSKVVALLLEHDTDADIEDEDGAMALIEACHRGSLEMVQALIDWKIKKDQDALEQFVNEEAGRGDTPLMTAILAGHTQIVKRLVELGAEKGKAEANLFLAVRRGDADGIRGLGQVRVNARNKDGHTALMEAIEGGHADAVQAILDLGPDTASAMELAALAGRVDILEGLLPRVGKNEKEATDALTAAARTGRAQVVNWLLEKSAANINGQQPTAVPLILAATNGYFEVVRILLDKNPDIDKCDKQGQTALSSAVLNDHQKIADLLIARGADQSKIGGAKLITEARQGNLAAVENLIKVVQDLHNGEREGRTAEEHSAVVKFLNSGDREGRTALIEAAAKGHEAVVKCLIEHGADIAHKSKAERTALMEACKGGHTKVVNYMLQYLDQTDKVKLHAVVDHADKNLNTPLKEALLSKHRDIARILESFGAKRGREEAEMLDAAERCRTGALEKLIKNAVGVNTSDRAGRTPLMLAAKNGCSGAVQVLLDAAADVNLKSRFTGETALIVAVKKGHRDIVNFLLKAKADHELAPTKGRTALMEAACLGYTEIVQALVDAGAEVNRKCESGESALIFAVRNGRKDIVDILIRANADVDVVTNKSRTALMEAADAGHVDILTSLAKKGADPNWSDETGMTALMIAVRKGYEKIVHCLVELERIDLDNVDKNGRTALTLAHLRGKLTGIHAAEFSATDQKLPQIIQSQVSAIESSLLNRGARKGWDEAEFILAACARDHKRIQSLIKKVNVNVKNLSGRTALLIAVIIGDKKIAETLIAAGVDVKARGDDTRTPLLQAARHAHLEIVSLLLEKEKTNVNDRDDNGDTALIEAARGGFEDILEKLMGAGASVSAFNNKGRTALMEAAANGNRAALDELLQHVGKDENQRDAVDGKGHTALDLARAGGHSECVNLLEDLEARTGAEVGLVVYISPTGRCYHRWNCPTIADARESRDLEPLRIYEASGKGYDPCGICEPQLAPVEKAQPRKILFLAANPTDTTRLGLGDEFDSIVKAIRESEFGDKLDLQCQWAVRAADLQPHLLRHKPNIVHFSGHGNLAGEIVLEDKSGKSKFVSVKALSRLFSILKDNIQCVVLNACFSEPQARAITEHIDYVIGMSTTITDPAAISFATAFYRALGYGKDIKEAFDLGCNQIHLENLSEEDTPKLLIQTKSNSREIPSINYPS